MESNTPAWKPIELADLQELVARSERELDPRTLRFWRLIRIPSVKWAQHPWGDLGGGFWVVAVFGRSALWYNDIEHGFNLSRYAPYGLLTDYWCNQDELFHVLNRLVDGIDTGDNPLTGNMGPPEPLNK